MVRALYRVLLIPAQDYARHPHLTRHHHIFDNFDGRFSITILNVRLRAGPRKIESKHKIVDVGIGTRSVLHSYILGYVAFHLELARLLKSDRYDCVVLSNVISPLIPLLFRGRPIVFDYKDVYSLSASTPLKPPVRQAVYWIARLFEQILFRFHMTVVVPSPSMQRLVWSRFGVKSVVISNGVNTKLFHPTTKAAREETRAELGLRAGEFCLCYLGSIENWIDLEVVVHALTQLKSLKLILIGGPPRSAEYLHHIMNLCDSTGVRDRVKFTGFKSQAEAARVLSACDAAIVPFPLDHQLTNVALPDKAFEYLASGIPVISSKLPDVEELFGDFVYFYDTPDKLVEILRDLSGQMKRRGSTKDQVTKVSKYDWRTIAARYSELLANLISNNERN